jgi:hypothetical protein
MQHARRVGMRLEDATGLPDWMRSDSSSPRRFSVARIASKHSQLRARADAAVDHQLRGFSATSGSRLFWIMR